MNNVRNRFGSSMADNLTSGAFNAVRKVVSTQSHYDQLVRSLYSHVNALFIKGASHKYISNEQR